MKTFRRHKNKYMSRLSFFLPALSKHLISSYTPLEFTDVPWAPITKSLSTSKIALVTTAGIHHRFQKPFDMDDPASDPTFRIIDSKTIEENFLITHDYYDHRDADKDLNIVFPVTRVREMAAAKVIGSIAEHHYSFMGHITGPHHLFEFAFWTSFGRTIQ